MMNKTAAATSNAASRFCFVMMLTAFPMFDKPFLPTSIHCLFGFVNT